MHFRYFSLNNNNNNNKNKNTPPPKCAFQTIISQIVCTHAQTRCTDTHTPQAHTMTARLHWHHCQLQNHTDCRLRGWGWGRGTQIIFWWGCATRGLKLLPIFKDFSTSKTADFTIFFAIFMKWDPLLRIVLTKMGPMTHLCSTSPYALHVSTPPAVGSINKNAKGEKTHTWIWKRTFCQTQKTGWP